MTAPNYRDHRIYMVHLFRVLHKRGASPPAEVYDEVADRAGIAPEQRAVPGREAGWNPVYRNRIVSETPGSKHNTSGVDSHMAIRNAVMTRLWRMTNRSIAGSDPCDRSLLRQGIAPD